MSQFSRYQFAMSKFWRYVLYICISFVGNPSNFWSHKKVGNKRKFNVTVWLINGVPKSQKNPTSQKLMKFWGNVETTSLHLQKIFGRKILSIFKVMSIFQKRVCKSQFCYIDVRQDETQVTVCFSMWENRCTAQDDAFLHRIQAFENSSNEVKGPKKAKKAKGPKMH